MQTNEIDKNTPLLKLTFGEFVAAMQEFLPAGKESAPQPRQLVYGVLGLRKILNIGKTKASEIIKSGVIEKATIRIGNRILIFDVDQVLEQLKNNPQWSAEK